MIDIPSFILRRRYFILVVIGITTLFLGFFSLRIKLNQNPDELIYKDDPEYPVLKEFYSNFGYDEIVVAVYSARNVLQEKHIEAIRKITTEIESIYAVDRVVSLSNALDIVTSGDSIKISPLINTTPFTQTEVPVLVNRINENPLYKDLIISSNADSALFDIILQEDLTNEERDGTIDRIRKIFLEHGKGDGYYLSGSPVGRSEMYLAVRRDFLTLLPLGMILLILSMYLFFRNYISIILPFIAVCLSVIWTIGFMYLLGAELNLLSVLIPTIIFIIGTSDCIHVLSQYKHCNTVSKTKHDAVATTIRLMVVPCALTSLTTAIGFLSLRVCRIEALQLFGTYSALGILLAYLLSIILIPVGLSLGDTRRFSLRKPPSDFLTSPLDRMYHFTKSNSTAIIFFSLLLVVPGIYGTTKLHVETDLINFFRSKTRFLTDSLFIEKELGGFIPLYILVDGRAEGTMKDPEMLNHIDRLTDFLRTVDGVDKVVSPSDLIKYANFRFHDSMAPYYRIPENRSQIAELLLMVSFSDDTGLLQKFFERNYQKLSVSIRSRYHDFYQIQAIREEVSNYIDQHFRPEVPADIYVTGTSMLIANTLVPIIQGLKQSLLIAIGIIFLLMIALFRSFKVAFISMIPNLIPVAITLGMMGILDISLNFGTAPIAAIALGLAIDDTIHFLARFRLEFQIQRDYSKAIYNTVQSVGKPIIISSIVLTTGFCIFLFSNFQPTQNMGVLISLTMMSAVFADLILLPVLLLVFKPLGKEAPKSC